MHALINDVQLRRQASQKGEGVIRGRTSRVGAAAPLPLPCIPPRPPLGMAWPSFPPGIIVTNSFLIFQLGFGSSRYSLRIFTRITLYGTIL